MAFPGGGPYARCGSWQVAQASLPDADKEGSKNIFRPSSAMVATPDCSGGELTLADADEHASTTAARQ
jgi:hypothetical protein